jgi:hypothetical protein
VDSRKRTVRVHTAVDQSVLITEGEALDGGAVLPGFVLRLDELCVNDEPRAPSLSDSFATRLNSLTAVH